jgi:8-oxo-dGTP pyrophosphatase MutT (NUDIX family)
LDTAIRETKEEIGLSLREHDCVRIGSHAVAGHYSGTEIGVALFMFELLELPETVKPCQKEVAMIHHLPEKTLLDPSMHLRDNFHPVMKNHFFPYIKISEAKCWGFTYECLIREYHLGEI